MEEFAAYRLRTEDFFFTAEVMTCKAFTMSSLLYSNGAVVSGATKRGNAITFRLLDHMLRCWELEVQSDDKFPV